MYNMLCCDNPYSISCFYHDYCNLTSNKCFCCPTHIWFCSFVCWDDNSDCSVCSEVFVCVYDALLHCLLACMKWWIEDDVIVFFISKIWIWQDIRVLSMIGESWSVLICVEIMMCDLYCPWSNITSINMECLDMWIVFSMILVSDVSTYQSVTTSEIENADILLVRYDIIFK